MCFPMGRPVPYGADSAATEQGIGHGCSGLQTVLPNRSLASVTTHVKLAALSDVPLGHVNRAATRLPGGNVVPVTA